MNKYLSCLTLPEERLGIFEMYALLLPWDAYQGFFAPDMEREALYEGWIRLLMGSARKAFFFKRADAEHPKPRLTRNSGIDRATGLPLCPEEGAAACERLLEYADVVRLSAKSQDNYLERVENQRAKRLPDSALKIIETALEEAELLAA